jgi:hypothetical protein
MRHYHFLVSFFLFYHLCFVKGDEGRIIGSTWVKQKNNDSLEMKKIDSLKTIVSVVLSSPIKKKDSGKNALISKTN